MMQRPPHIRAQIIRNVAEGIERSIAGLHEGGHVEDQLWPAVKSVGVRRADFDEAVETLISQRRVRRSYDRIYA
jgi:hypothetical protein